MPPIQKYWVMTRPESFGRRIEYVGPHPLDKIRLWVHEEILSPNVQIQPTGEGCSEWIRAKDLPGFYDFPAGLTEQIGRRRRDEKRGGAADPDPALITASQSECLEFMKPSLEFQGISLRQKILISYRANKLIHQLAEFDPDLYQEWSSRSPARGPEITRAYVVPPRSDLNPQYFTGEFLRPNMRGPAGNIIAALASFFIPGLGQLAQGRIFFAFSCFAIAALLWLMAVVSLGLLSPLTLVVHILLGIIACLDAARWNGGH
jgi:hypothetical protein